MELALFCPECYCWLRLHGECDTCGVDWSPAYDRFIADLALSLIEGC